jgi:hypothetical protein
MTDTTKPVKPGIRERRHIDAVRLVTNLVDLRERTFDKLVRLNRKLTVARRTLARYEKLIASQPAAVTPPASPKPTAAKPTASATVETPAPPPAARPAPASGDLEVPAFLRREPNGPGELADAKAAAEIEAGQKARRTAKSKGRVAKLLATKAGDRRRMPLSGKAALDAIRDC